MTDPAPTNTPAPPAEPGTTHDDTRAILHAIDTFSRAQRRIGTAFIHELGLPRAALGALFKLRTHGALQISELAQLLDVDVSVASRQATVLVDAGLAIRDIDPADRRARTIALSPTGHERASAARAAVADLLADAVRDWDRERLTAFAASLEDLSESVITRFSGTQSQHKDHA